jgi:predicted nucleic acid-binding protein
MALSPTVLITPFVRAEFCAAIYQQIFHRRTLSSQVDQVWRDFEKDCDDGSLSRIDFPLLALKRCADLARRYTPTLGVRTLDSLHVACALELNAQKFWTFDDRQAKLAEAVGLDTTA